MRVPGLFQKCKAGSAVKDVEAANFEVEYGLVSPRAAAKAVEAASDGALPFLNILNLYSTATWKISLEIFPQFCPALQYSFTLSSCSRPQVAE